MSKDNNSRKKLFAQKLLKGGAKCIPLIGGLVEETIFGTLEALEAQKEQEKLHALIKDFISNTDIQQDNIAQILLKQSLQAGFNEKIVSMLEELKNKIQSLPSDDESIIEDDTLPVMPRVFISHSSKDKPFVNKLISDLTAHGIYVWFDVKELAPGDSIVEGVSKGIEQSDYFIVVLSTNSIKSNWVRAELNAALMEQLSNQDIVIIPARIDDCDVPTLLKDRLYADFTSDYETALNSIINVLKQDKEPVISQVIPSTPQVAIMRDIEGRTSDESSCPAILSKLSRAQLRRLLTRELDRPALSVIWADTLETRMDDDMAHKYKNECASELIYRANQGALIPKLIENICADKPDIANP